MSWLTLSELKSMIHGKQIGDDAAFDCVFTDTRHANPKGLFFALPGPNFDPHDVLEKSPVDVAAALVVSRPVDHPAPQLVVSDTYQALSEFAGIWRKRFMGPLVALTGSNGKTTLKEMLLAILSTQGEVLATEGNLNNHIGVPLTLLRLRDQYQYAVIEMGANKAGDIAELTRLGRPDVAIVNNAAAAHLEGFGSVENVATCKGEIFSGLDHNGLAVINADDDFADYWHWLARSYRLMTFGQAPDADVRIKRFSPAIFMIGDELIEVNLQLEGDHNVRNAAAAITAAIGLGVATADIVAGLEKMRPVAGRLDTREGPNNSKLIDDSYNANPGSVRAAIDVLAQESGRTVLVLGDMAELGQDGDKLHQEVGVYAAAKGIDALMTMGTFTLETNAAFSGERHHFNDAADLASKLYEYLDDDCTVLVKGSRSMKMERVIQALNGMSANPTEEQDHAA